MAPRSASMETEMEIDAQVTRLVENAYQVCLKTLSENKALLDALTEKLIVEETIDYQVHPTVTPQRLTNPHASTSPL